MTLLPTLPHLYLNNKTSIQVYEKFRKRTVNDYISPQIIFRIIYHHEDEIDCPICLEHPTLPRMDKCGHIFCLSCLIKLCSHEATSAYVLCPLCKSCHISVKSSKRVVLKTLSPPQEGQQISFRLLAKGKKSKYPDYHDNLSALYPYAPFEADPVAKISPIAVISDRAVLDEFEQDRYTIKNRNRSEDETETLKFLTNELLEFRSTIEIIPINTSSDPRYDLLDSFNFLIDPDKQSDRFDLFYQSLSDKHVLLEPSQATQLITRWKDSEEGLLAEIYGKIIAMRTMKTTSSTQTESHLSHIPLGAAITFVTIDLNIMWYAHSSGKNYPRARKAKDTIEKDALLLATARQESQEKQNKLKLEGKKFTPMIDHPINNPSTSRVHNDEIPTSFNLCMFGLLCDDPDDDYPHDVTCYRYHDAYRRQEFAETVLLEENSP